jgi:hypothetical protein
LGEEKKLMGEIGWFFTRKMLTSLPRILVNDTSNSKNTLKCA